MAAEYMTDDTDDDSDDLIDPRDLWMDDDEDLLESPLFAARNRQRRLTALRYLEERREYQRLRDELRDVYLEDEDY